MAVSAGTQFREQPTGLEDVIRSVRALARTTRGMGEAAADIMERELAMAITISERIRDQVVSAEALKQAREEPLPARLRDDAHRAVDLFADAASVIYVNTIRFFEGLTDERRPALTTAAAETSGEESGGLAKGR